MTLKQKTKLLTLMGTLMSVNPSKKQMIFDKKLTNFIQKYKNKQDVVDAVTETDIYFRELKKDIADMKFFPNYTVFLLSERFSINDLKDVKIRKDFFESEEFSADPKPDITENSVKIADKIIQWLVSSEEFEDKKFRLKQIDKNQLERLNVMTTGIETDHNIQFLREFGFGISKNAVFEIDIFDFEDDRTCFSVVINGKTGVFDGESLELLWSTDFKLEFKSNIEYFDGKFHAIVKHDDKIMLCVYNNEEKEFFELDDIIFSEDQFEYIDIFANSKGYYCTFNEQKEVYGDYGVMIDKEGRFVKTLEDEFLAKERSCPFLDEFPERVGFRHVRDQRFTNSYSAKDGWTAYFLVSTSGKTKQGLFNVETKQVFDMGRTKFFKNSFQVIYKRTNSLGINQTLFLDVKNPICFDLADIDNHVHRVVKKKKQIELKNKENKEDTKTPDSSVQSSKKPKLIDGFPILKGA